MMTPIGNKEEYTITNFVEDQTVQTTYENNKLSPLDMIVENYKRMTDEEKLNWALGIALKHLDEDKKDD